MFFNHVSFNFLKLPIILYSVFILTQCILSDDNSSLMDLLDRSHFENYEYVRRFLLIDPDPETIDTLNPLVYYYYFNILAEKPSGTETDNQHPQKFFFDMMDYNKDYPESTFGAKIDHSNLGFNTETEAEIGHNMVTDIVLPNNFYKAEISISENNCLTLFMFIDSHPLTDILLYKKSHDVLFDMSSSPNNNFYFSVKNYFGHARDSFEVVYNDIGSFSDKIYLKVACPFFSVFGENKIKMKIKLIPSNYEFNCK